MARDIAKLIFNDDLTGLYNRRFLGHYLKNEVDWTRDSAFAVIMIDLDGFKGVNDTLGHLEGDRLLKRTAEIIRSILPERGAYAIRYAGDEFTMILEGHDRDMGRTVAERFRSRVEEDELGGGSGDKKVPVTVSVGVAAFPQDARAPEDLVEAADSALYYSKHNGKNLVSTVVEVRVAERHTPRLPCPVLVGRDEIWRLVRERLDQAAAGAPANLLLVEGGRGVGKSRLLAELVKMAASAGTECLLERIVAVNRRIPYGAVAPVLDHYFSRTTDVDLSQLDPPDLKEVARLIPALQPRVPAELAGAQTGGDADPGLDRRRRFFGGFVGLLEAIARKKALLILLDDIQNVDEGSLEILRALLEKRSPRVLIVAAARPIDPASEVGQFLRSAKAFVEPVKLNPLEADRVSDMVSAILPERPMVPAFDDSMIVASGGVPLLVEAGLGTLIEKGAVHYGTDGWRIPEVKPADLPSSIERLVETRLATVDPELRDLLRKAAVIGPNFSLQVLAGVSSKNEAEALDMVKKARALNIFGESAGLDEDEVTFVSECFREILYDGIAATERTETHRKVGEVHEEVFKDSIDGVVADLAFHFERAGDERAKHYDKRVEEVRADRYREDEVAEYYRTALKVDIPEFATTLGDEEKKLVLTVVRTFGVAVKNGRLYPPGARPLAEAQKAALDAIVRALGRLPGFTVGELGGQLTLNGAADAGAVGGEDLVKILRDQYVKSVTFLRGAQSDEIDGVSSCLAEAPKDRAPPMTYWVQRLTEKKVKHVGLMPRIYTREAEAGGGAAAAAAARREATLDDEQQRKAGAALRKLLAAVDAIRLYPEGSATVAEAREVLEREMVAAREGIPILTFGLGEGADLLVNGIPGSLRSLGASSQSIRKLFEDRGVASVAFEEGVAPEDVRAFADLLAHIGPGGEAPPESWADALAAKSIHHVVVGARIYKVAEGRRVREAPKPEEPEKKEPEKKEEAPAAEMPQATGATGRARALLAQMADDAVKDPEAVAQITEQLVLSGDDALATQLLDHAAVAFLAPKAPVRSSAAKIGSLLGRARDPRVARFAARRLTRPLADALRGEEDVEVYGAWSEAASEMVLRLLDAEDPETASILLYALEQPIDAAAKHKGPAGADRAAAARKALKRISSSTALDTYSRGLGSDDPKLRETSERLVAGLGEGAVPLLAGVVRSVAPLKARRFAAAIIRRAGAGLPIAREVGPDGEPHRCRHVLEVLDDLVEDPLEVAIHALGHADRGVREEAARVLARADIWKVRDLLRSVLEHGTGMAAVGAIEATADLPGGAGTFAEAVAKRLLVEKDVEVMKACCRMLATVGSDKCIEALAHVLGGRPGILRAGYPAEGRLAAAQALALIVHPASDSALADAARKDPDEKVRKAAEMTLELRPLRRSHQTATPAD